MRKNVTLVAILLLLVPVYFFASQDYPKLIGKGYYKIKGGYKSRSLFNYMYKLGVVDIQSKRLGGYDYFDFKGNIIKSTYIDGANKNTLANTYKYDNNDNMIEKLQYKSDGSVEIRTVYKYNNLGNRTDETCYKSDASFIGKIVYFYDDIGNMVKSLQYDNYERLLYKKTFKYNDKREKIEELQHYLDDRSGGFKSTYKYDGNGNLVEEKGLFKINYKYDTMGNLTEEVGYSGDRIFKRTIYKYDSIGNIIEEVVYDEVYSIDEPAAKQIYIYSK